LGGRRLAAAQEIQMHHPIDPTTHTVEMRQVAELNQHLTGPQARTITAAELGLPGAGVGALSGQAALLRLSWDGSPGFPDIHAHFAAPGRDAAGTRVRLHTAQLHELSRRLGLHHRWGV